MMRHPLKCTVPLWRPLDVRQFPSPILISVFAPRFVGEFSILHSGKLWSDFFLEKNYPFAF